MSFGRRRGRQVNHAGRQASQARQRFGLVQVPLQRRDAERAQGPNAPWRRSEGKQPNPPVERARNPQAHVPASNDQDPFTAEARGQRAKRTLVRGHNRSGLRQDFEDT